MKDHYTKTEISTELNPSNIPTPKEILDNLDDFAQTLNLMNEHDMSFELASAIIKNKLKTALTTTLQDYLEPEGIDVLRQKIQDTVQDYFDNLPYKPYNIEVTQGKNNSYDVTCVFQVNDPIERQRLLDAGFKEVHEI